MNWSCERGLAKNRFVCGCPFCDSTFRWPSVVSFHIFLQNNLHLRRYCQGLHVDDHFDQVQLNLFGNLFRSGHEDNTYGRQ